MCDQNPVSVVKKMNWLVLFCGALLSFAATAEPGVGADTLRLGQSTSLSGPLGDLGQEILKGSKVYFDALNARGGVNGRKIVLVSNDDAYDSKKTVENVGAFIKDDATFALFGTFGTPNNEALIPIAQAAGMPVLMPYSGAPSIRSKSFKGVFNIRASYADEVERLVEHLSTVGVKRIAIAYQNNAFGKEVLAAATEAMEKRQLKPILAVTVENNASDAVTATEKLLRTNPEAVLLGLAGKPTIEVIKSVKQQRRGLQMYALSVLATPSNLRALGADGTGVAITQVVPFPVNSYRVVACEPGGLYQRQGGRRRLAPRRPQPHARWPGHGIGWHAQLQLGRYGGVLRSGGYQRFALRGVDLDQLTRQADQVRKIAVGGHIDIQPAH
jgi:branched-chain amino acid transport system substrate-binding protein